MEVRRSTKLPEGVGKKIIEALKRQSDVHENAETPPSFDDYVTPATDNNLNEEFNYLDDEEETDYLNKDSNEESYWNSEDEEDEQDDESTSYYSTTEEDESDNDFSLDSEEEETPAAEYTTQYQTEDSDEDSDYDAYEFYSNNAREVVEEEPIIEKRQVAEPRHMKIEQDLYRSQYTEDPPQPAPRSERPKMQQRPRISRPTREESIEIPKAKSVEATKSTNINILINLIAQLPPGVTKQTGAQIIRQTMEAMGLSMNNVVSEGKLIQDEFLSKMKNHAVTIEDYKAQIKNLEKEMLTFKKQSEELKEILSLFIFSDKHSRR